MKIARCSLIVAGAFAAVVGLQTPAAAQTNAGSMTIGRIHTGWGDDLFRIQPPSGYVSVNPANCPYTDGYVSHIEQKGYDTHYRLVLEAYRQSKPVVIVVSNTLCTHGRPVIYGLML